MFRRKEVVVGRALLLDRGPLALRGTGNLGPHYGVWKR